MTFGSRETKFRSSWQGIWVIHVWVNQRKMTGKWGEIKGKLDLLWVSGKFELSEFELSGFYSSHTISQMASRFQPPCLWNFQNALSPLPSESYNCKIPSHPLPFRFSLFSFFWELLAGFANTPTLAYFTPKYFKWLYFCTSVQLVTEGIIMIPRNSGMKILKK